MGRFVFRSSHLASLSTIASIPPFLVGTTPRDFPVDVALSHQKKLDACIESIKSNLYHGFKRGQRHNRTVLCLIITRGRQDSSKLT